MSINPEESQETPAPVADSTQESVKPQITEKQAARINAPARNMVISMIVMIALLVPFLMLAPQLTNTKNFYEPDVDLHGAAYNAGQEAKFPVATPQVEGWTYNFARWNSGQADGIDFWNTGLVTKEQNFIDLTQAKDTNPTWVANKVENAPIAGTQEIGGVEWEIRTLTDPKEDKTTSSYIGELDGTTVILKGEANPQEFEQLAQAVINYSKTPSMTAEPSATSGIK